MTVRTAGHPALDRAFPRSARTTWSSRVGAAVGTDPRSGRLAYWPGTDALSLERGSAVRALQRWPARRPLRRRQSGRVHRGGRALVAALDRHLSLRSVTPPRCGCRELVSRARQGRDRRRQGRRRAERRYASGLSGSRTELSRAPARSAGCGRPSAVRRPAGGGPGTGHCGARLAVLLFVVLGAVSLVLVAAVVVSTVLCVQAGNRRHPPVAARPKRSTPSRLTRRLRQPGDGGARLLAVARSAGVPGPVRRQYRATGHRTTSPRIRRALIGIGPRACWHGADGSCRTAAADVWQAHLSPKRPIARWCRRRRRHEHARRSSATPAKSTRSTGMRAESASLTTKLHDKAIVARDPQCSVRRHHQWAIAFASLAVPGMQLSSLLGGLVLWRGLTPLDPRSRSNRLAGQIRDGRIRATTQREIVPDGPGRAHRPRAVTWKRCAVQIAAAARYVAERIQCRSCCERSARSWRAPTTTCSSSPTSRRTTCPSRCARSPTSASCSSASTAEQLDDRARQYIDFAVDGAKRMQALITDLLALSRVGRSTEEFRPGSI